MARSVSSVAPAYLLQLLESTFHFHLLERRRYLAAYDGNGIYGPIQGSFNFSPETVTGHDGEYYVAARGLSTSRSHAAF